MIDALQHRSAAKELGVRLGVIADEKGISQKSISETTGISETTISRIFTGKFCAKSDYLVCLAAAVGVIIIYSDCG
jgi:transcriptional regulator with XRE-family HTH domain